MGLGGISIWQLLIVLGIIILIFGTKKLRGLGSDLGNAVKGFKSALKENEQHTEQTAQERRQPESLEASATRVDLSKQSAPSSSSSFEKERQ